MHLEVQIAVERLQNADPFLGCRLRTTIAGNAGSIPVGVLDGIREGFSSEDNAEPVWKDDNVVLNLDIKTTKHTVDRCEFGKRVVELGSRIRELFLEFSLEPLPEKSIKVTRVDGVIIWI